VRRGWRGLNPRLPPQRSGVCAPFANYAGLYNTSGTTKGNIVLGLVKKCTGPYFSTPLVSTLLIHHMSRWAQQQRHCIPPNPCLCTVFNKKLKIVVQVEWFIFGYVWYWYSLYLKQSRWRSQHQQCVYGNCC
jgi:hypothetical protein